MIDIPSHRTVLVNIVKDIYEDTKLAPMLGFKGGTCLYFFHQLPRFSTDLDFNVVVTPEQFDAQRLNTIIEKHITIEDMIEKRNTWFWIGSYRKGYHHIKLEMSKRDYPDEYELQDFFGVGVQSMRREYLFAHKLCAIMDRKTMANRDLFDAYFMLKENFPLAEDIIQLRMGKTVPEYFDTLVEYIPTHIRAGGILNGLGELLTDKQKEWAKHHLVKDLLFYLRSYADIIRRHEAAE